MYIKENAFTDEKKTKREKCKSVGEPQLRRRYPERKRYKKERRGWDEKEWKVEKGRAQQEIYWHRRFPLQGSLSQNI